MKKCKYEGSGVWKGRCVGTKEIDPCPGHDKCDRFKPNYKTNADHIRSMTDEELAKWLTWFIEITFEANDLCDDFEVAETFEVDLLNQLKQPYKEET